MGFVRRSLLTAVAAKIVQEARKPQNQRKIRELVESRRAKASGRRAT